jgi:hypothetical protein
VVATNISLSLLEWKDDEGVVGGRILVDLHILTLLLDEDVWPRLKGCRFNYRVRQKNLTVFKSRYIGKSSGFSAAPCI